MWHNKVDLDFFQCNYWYPNISWSLGIKISAGTVVLGGSLSWECVCEAALPLRPLTGALKTTIWFPFHSLRCCFFLFFNELSWDSTHWTGVYVYFPLTSLIRVLKLLRLKLSQVRIYRTVIESVYVSICVIISSCILVC